jgi:hypothetical protein
MKSNHLPHVKRGLVESLHKRDSIMYQEQEDLFNEIGSLRCELQLNGCPKSSIDLVINSKRSNLPDKEEKPWAVCIS